jgi:hypothetical protein
MKILFRLYSVLFIFLFIILVQCSNNNTEILNVKDFKPYFTQFNQNDQEIYTQHISNNKASDFLKNNIPLFECPNETIEQTYYYRWWTFRKHIKKTPEGFVITEFLPNVGHSGKYNTINCAVGHHIYEGRWLKNPKFINDYINFWLHNADDKLRDYSCWIADAILAFNEVYRDDSAMINQLPYLVNNYKEWEKIRRDNSNILFWQYDNRDGMEYTASGRILNDGKKTGWQAGVRPTINSYMYGDAKAISRIAGIANKSKIKSSFNKKAVQLKSSFQNLLWNDSLSFFTVLPRDYKKSSQPLDVRELVGYIPWYFNLPDNNGIYSKAWHQLQDTLGFKALYGPTTCEQRHPYFEVVHKGHPCEWNGPSWPYATSQTLTAMANLLNNYDQNVVNKTDYFNLINKYAKSHNWQVIEGQGRAGKEISYIGESLDPFSGKWIARSKDYNHSTFCDLVISGLIGVRPQIDDTIIINPLVLEGTWDWFCLEKVPYHGGELTVLWDRTGDQYGMGQGFQVYYNGNKLFSSEKLEKINIKLP